jgi:hypothetical protein
MSFGNPAASISTARRIFGGRCGVRSHRAWQSWRNPCWSGKWDTTGYGPDNDIPH